MKTYFYGSPEQFGWMRSLSAWCKKSPLWGWRRWVASLVLVPFVFSSLFLAWLCVKVGSFGHWLAFGIGFDSHDTWE